MTCNSILIFVGTKIFYDRSFLLECRNSPLTKSPPPNMAKIPGVTAPGDVDLPKENVIQETKEKPSGKIFYPLNFLLYNISCQLQVHEKCKCKILC